MRSIGLYLLLGLAGLAPAQGADGIRETRVHFKPGASGTTIAGHLQGANDIDYLIRAQAGQRMTATLTANNPQAYFNVLPPGGAGALFVGSSDGGRFAGTLPESGDYIVRVYLMRPAARRGEEASYRLALHIGGPHHTEAPVHGPDYADGLAGGPDFWQVTDVAQDDRLTLRSAPSASAKAIVGLQNGTVMRNLGCEMHGGQRWCQVATRHEPSRRGWVAGRYLREASE